MTEEWRPVVGWEGIYSVSSLGRIRRELPGPGTFPGRLNKLSWGGGRGKGQYLCVRLSVDNRGRTSRVASLVAAAFIGPKPLGLEINHIDGNVTNNTPENLEYVTALEQQRHASRIGIKCHGERHAFAKLSDEKVREIRRRGAPIAEFMRRFGVSKSTIDSVLSGKTWKHVV